MNEITFAWTLSITAGEERFLAWVYTGEVLAGILSFTLPEAEEFHNLLGERSIVEQDWDNVCV